MNDTTIHDQTQYILFENEAKRHLKKELNNLPNIMENPYQILRRFIKWEMMDLEAMADTIESKNEFTKRKNSVQNKMSSNAKELNKLQKGGSFLGTF
jgi:hypothetical protein